MSASESRPSFPFYGREWYSSKRVRVLTPVQRLIYLALLWAQWESRGVPDDEQELELIAASEGGAISDVRRVLKLCFDLRDGRWHNAKLAEIRDELDAHRAKQRESGARGGRSKAEGSLSDPKGLLSDPKGLLSDPLAKATSSSASSSSSSSAPREEPSSSLRSEPSARKPRRPPEKAGTELTRWWDAEWLRTRGAMAPRGETPEFGWTKADAVALARCVKLKGSSEGEVRARVTRMLDDPDPWVAQNATPRLLLSAWNRFAVTIRPLSKRERGMIEFEAALTKAGVPGANGVPA